MLDQLQHAADRRITFDAKVEAVQRAMDRAGASGTVEIRRDGAHFNSDQGAYYMCRKGRVRRSNPATAAATPTKQGLTKAAKSKKTEQGQVNAVAEYLGAHGITKAPTTTVLYERGRVVRAYTWKGTPIGDVILLAGPAWEPMVQVHNDDSAWQAAPAGAYAVADDYTRSPQHSAATQRAASRGAGHAESAPRRPAATRAPAPRPTRTAAPPKPSKPRTQTRAPAPPQPPPAPAPKASSSDDELLAKFAKLMEAIPIE